MTPIALATDAGCSTRLPAACTGTFGLKPTLGRIPHDRVPDAFGTFIHLGVIARAVGDLALALGALAGPHDADPHSLRVRSFPEGEPGGGRGLGGRRVVLWMTTGNRRVAKEVRDATRRAAEVLVALGAEVVEADYALPHPDPVWRVLQQSNWAMRFAAASATDRALLSRTLNEGIDEALGYSALDLSRAQAKRAELFRGVQRVFDAQADFILTPCVSAPPVAAEYDLTEPLVIDGEAVGDLRSEWTPYLSLFDLTGHPALAIPIGFAANGGPLGVQLVARWDGEADLLAAAGAFEAAFPPALWREG
jgi:aspartyl-tRNA(Asn)/glutamyl-tRNA(Gln) amidotransferase subunit A